MFCKIAIEDSSLSLSLSLFVYSCKVYKEVEVGIESKEARRSIKEKRLLPYISTYKLIRFLFESIYLYL